MPSRHVRQRRFRCEEMGALAAQRNQVLVVLLQVLRQGGAYSSPPSTLPRCSAPNRFDSSRVVRFRRSWKSSGEGEEVREVPECQDLLLAHLRKRWLVVQQVLLRSSQRFEKGEEGVSVDPLNPVFTPAVVLPRICPAPRQFETTLEMN